MEDLPSVPEVGRGRAAIAVRQTLALTTTPHGLQASGRVTGPSSGC